MARSRLRPRAVNGALGGYVLVIAIIAWWFANSPTGSGYAYGPETTRWALFAYMVTAGALLSGLAGVAVSAMRHMDRRIDAAEGAALPAPPEAEPDLSGEAPPPPLEETPEGRDHVDQDIDDLLVSLQEIETTAEGSEQVVEEVAEVPAMPAKAPRMAAPSTRALEALKLQRRQLPAFFAGPALAAIGIIAIGAMLLPGADALLQSWQQLNTAVILGIGYAYPGIALFTGIAFYAILRAK
jgi:type IV secretory pathway VirB2 component (pilin)